MAYKALYREYRPQTFDEVVGQKYIVQTLKNEIRDGKVNHAYLFTGPRGTGKTTIAKLIAKALNCLGEDKPCGVCDHCRAIADGSYPDVVEMDAASNNGVDEVRDLIEKLKYTPMQGKYKVYIIDEVHMMTANAFNALLKTLEEPPENVIFILATTEVQKVPATIISRCQRFDFGRISQKDLEKKLIEVLDKEGITYEPGVVSLVAALADGGVRDALGILEQTIAYQTDNITEQSVRDIYGVLSSFEAIEFLKTVHDHQVIKALKSLDDFETKGVDIPRFTTMLVNILKEVIVYNKTDSIEHLQLLNSLNVVELARFMDSKTAFKYIDILLEALNSYPKVSTPRSYFELAILKLCDVESFPDKEIKYVQQPIEKPVVEHVGQKPIFSEEVFEEKEEENNVPQFTTNISPENEREDEEEEVEEEPIVETFSQQETTWNQPVIEEQVDEDEEVEEESFESSEETEEPAQEETQQPLYNEVHWNQPQDTEEDEVDEDDDKTVGDIIEELGAVDYEYLDDFEGYEVFKPVYYEPNNDDHLIFFKEGKARLATDDEVLEFYCAQDETEETEEPVVEEQTKVETFTQQEVTWNQPAIEEQVEEDEEVEEEGFESSEETEEPVQKETYHEFNQPSEQPEEAETEEESFEVSEEDESEEEESFVEEAEEIEEPVIEESVEEEQVEEPVVEEQPVQVSQPIEIKQAEITKEMIINYLVQSNKEIRLSLSNIWNSLHKYCSMPKYVRAANCLRDGKIAAASEDGILVCMDTRSEADIANSPNMYFECKELIAELFGKEYKYIATYTDEFKEIKVIFRQAYDTHTLPNPQPIKDLYDPSIKEAVKDSFKDEETKNEIDEVESIFGDILD